MERQAASSWRRSHTPPHSDRRQAAAIGRERHLGAAQRTSPGSAVRKRDRAPPPEQVWRAYEPDIDPFRRQPLYAEASSATIDASTQTEVAADDLGRYGPVHLMSMATIDEVMARLSEVRKTELQRPCEETDLAPEDSEPTTTGDGPVLTDDAPVQAPTRSRSYEALVQMEAILEARHRQLMEHGTLEAYACAPAKTRLAMTDIQDEIARMHMQLHPRPTTQ